MIKQSPIFISPKGIKKKLKEFISANIILEKQNKLKNAINFVGHPGISKTSSVIQFCKEQNIGCEKVNMANIDDLGEITGYPIKEYQFVDKCDNFIWVNEKMFDTFINNTAYKATGKIRTGYAEPKWVSNLKEHEISVLLLDDSQRAQQRFSNAIMELICAGEYYGWKLPPGCNIVMTNNPDIGDYQVSSVDAAQTTRFFTFWVRFDEQDWAEYAEKENIPGSFINFILSESSIIFKNIDDNYEKGGVSNPRQWTMLFNSLANLNKEYATPEALLQIQENGKAILPEELVTLFIRFLQTKDWDIPEPRYLFEEQDEYIIAEKLKEQIGLYNEPKHKAAQAAILAIRIVNWLKNFMRTSTLTEKHILRLQFLMEKTVFGKDVNYTIIRDLGIENPQVYDLLMQNRYFVKEILS